VAPGQQSQNAQGLQRAYQQSGPGKTAAARINKARALVLTKLGFDTPWGSSSNPWAAGRQQTLRPGNTVRPPSPVPQPQTRPPTPPPTPYPSGHQAGSPGSDLPPDQPPAAPPRTGRLTPPDPTYAARNKPLFGPADVKPTPPDPTYAARNKLPSWVTNPAPAAKPATKPPGPAYPDSDDQPPAPAQPGSAFGGTGQDWASRMRQQFAQQRQQQQGQPGHQPGQQFPGPGWDVYNYGSPYTPVQQQQAGGFGGQPFGGMWNRGGYAPQNRMRGQPLAGQSAALYNAPPPPGQQGQPGYPNRHGVRHPGQLRRLAATEPCTEGVAIRNESESDEGRTSCYT
jgi:hypothetical protein